MAWLSWEKMRLPKAMGGMGFRDMRAFNQALLAKQAWRLIETPDSLCARLLKAKYFAAGHLLDTVFTGNGLAVWKGILHGLELLKKGIIWRVGNGTLIRTWRDPWIPRPYSYRPITPKRNCRFNRVSDFLDMNGAWRMDRLRDHFWAMDIEHILKIRTSPRLRTDFVAWAPEKSGLFTVRSAYKVATCDHDVALAGGSSSSEPCGRRTLWNCIWNSSVPQRMKISAWKVATGALPTQKCKRFRHLSTRSTCPLCGIEEEGSYHALVACPHARNIWISMRTRWPLPGDEMLIDNGKEWLLHLLSRCSENTRDMIIMLCWRIWQLRSDQTHGKEVPPAHVTVDFLDSYYLSVRLAGRFSTNEIIKGKMLSSSIPLMAQLAALFSQQ